MRVSAEAPSAVEPSNGRPPLNSRFIQGQKYALRIPSFKMTCHNRPIAMPAKASQTHLKC